MKIMDKLSTYAALIGVVGAIGGGFYTWGQFNSRLDAIEKKPVVNLTSLKQKDIALTKQFDDVLLYANEYKVDLIDRIAKVEEKIKPTDLAPVYEKINSVESKIKDTDLTNVFKEISKIREEVALLDIPEDVDLKPITQKLTYLSEELIRVMAMIPEKVILTPFLQSIQALEKELAIVQKENEVQDAMMEELKLKLKNPLGN